MAANVTLNLATVGGGSTIATEDIGGVQFQRVKLALGNSGQDLGDVSGSNPLVVEMGGASTSVFGDLITAENTPLVQLDFVYGINTQTGVSAIVTTGVADTNLGRLRLQTGVGATGAALFTSRRSAKYRSGQGITARFTGAFTAGVANSRQVNGVGTADDGYFFGYNDNVFGLLHRNAGVDTWVAQTAWNGDKCDGTGPTAFTLNPTLGNVYQIRYPFLGYGAISFWVSDVTGRWIRCHTIQYPNTSASTQLSNPNLNYYAQVLNAGNTTNLVLYVGSVGILLSGARAFISNAQWAYDNNKVSVTAETNLFSIKNATTYNGVTNRGMVRINSLSFAATASAANILAVCRLRIGATLGGTATYAPINGATADNGVTITAGNAITSVNTVHTTATGGTYIYNLSVSGQSTLVIDLTPYELYVAPGEILTVSGYATLSASISASLNWTEDL